MSSKTWGFSKEYAEASENKKKMLEALDDMLFEVQYAKMGDKAAMRREYALQIVNAFEIAYKVHKGGLGALE